MLNDHCHRVSTHLRSINIIIIIIIECDADRYWRFGDTCCLSCPQQKPVNVLSWIWRQSQFKGAVAQRGVKYRKRDTNCIREIWWLSVHCGVAVVVCALHWEKLTVAQIIHNFADFVKLRFHHEYGNELYFEPDETNPHPHTMTSYFRSTEFASDLHSTFP